MFRHLKCREITIVFLIFVLGVIGHFWATDFLKGIVVYPDELRYLLPAQSMFEGGGNVVYNLTSPYQKTGYALFLIPFFSIDDAVLRIRAIGFGNACLVTMAVFFAYLLAKELKLKTKDVYLSVLVSAILPVSLLSMGFMSETLYYPLVLAFAYLFALYERKQNITTAILLGAVGYYGYLTKEIFLSLIISAVLTEIFTIFQNRQNKAYFKKRIGLLLLFLSVYIALFAVVKYFFFYGLGNSYHQMGIEPVSSWHGIGYLFYTLADYIAAMLVCYFVLPPVMIAAVFFKAEDKFKRMIFFIGLVGIIAAVAVSYTILVREDLHHTVPRLHLRYVAPFFAPVFILFLKAMDEFNFKADGKFLTYLLLGSVVFICFVFKGTVAVSASDQQDLFWYTWVRDTIGYIKTESGSFLFVGVWTINLLIAAVTLILAYMMHKMAMQKVKYICVAVILALMAVNDVIVYQTLRDEYIITEEQADEMKKINDFFADKEGNVAYFANHPYKPRRIFDIYFNKKSNLFALHGWEILQSNDWFDMNEHNLLDAWQDKQYSQLNHVEWIILDNAVRTGAKSFADVQYIPEASGKMFSVYRNFNPQFIQLIPDETLFYKGGIFHIYIDEEKDNTKYYVLYGLSQSEDDRGWMSSDKIGFNVPSLVQEGKIRVEIEVVETFLNGKFDYIFSHGDKPLGEGAIQDKGLITFDVPIEGQSIYFELTVKNAKYVHETIPFHSNINMFSFKIGKITLYPLENDD